jgi:hypothetical protein
MADDQDLPTLEELDELDAKARARSRKDGLERVQALSERLFEAGAERLTAVPDEEWDAAVLASEGEE